MEEFAEVLERDELPCFVMFGADESTWSPAEQRAMAERLGVPFAAIPGGGHSVNVQQPKRVVDALLGFWASVGEGAALNGAGAGAAERRRPSRRGRRPQWTSSEPLRRSSSRSALIQFYQAQ